MNRRTWVFAAQAALTCGVFAYLYARTDVAKVAAALRNSPWWSLPLACALLASVMWIGALRWRALLHVYGAERLPPTAKLFRLQLVGLFYNMLPGAVGGDVVRGVVSRDAFGARGAGAGVVVVLLERVSGLLGLIVLSGTMLAIHPVPHLMLPKSLYLVPVLLSVLAGAGVAAGRRFAPWLPARIRPWASALPELRHPIGLPWVLVLAVSNQAVVGLVCHALISPLAPQVTMLDSVTLAPLAFAAIFFPLTVAGAGTRDSAMVFLYGLIGVPEATVMGASIQVLLVYLLVAGAGGLLSLQKTSLAPHTAPAPPSPD